MMNTEAFIVKNSARYLPKQRSRFIDLATIALSEYEDDFFTYDQIKNLVIQVLIKHEDNDSQWSIDISNSTREEVVVVDQKTNTQAKIPINLFMATAIRPAVH